MALISTSYIETNFPLVKQMAKTAGDYDSGLVTDVLDTAEAELSRYITVTEDTITEDQKLHLLNIFAYHVFMRLKGDVEFEIKPRIIKDYETSIEQLKFTSVTDAEDGYKKVTVTARSKRFVDNWFTPNYDD